MDYLILGFLTGLSLILSNRCSKYICHRTRLKKTIYFYCLFNLFNFRFLLIFLGIFLFQYLSNFFTPTVELIFNILLLIFLLHFIWGKIKTKVSELHLMWIVKLIIYLAF